MASQTAELVLSLEPESTDDTERLAELTMQLRDELLDLDVEDVAYAIGGDVPSRAKAGEPVAWGTLLVTLAASGGVMTALVNVLQTWLSRQEGRSLTLEIDGDRLEMTGISSEEQERLAKAWLRRHRGFVLPDD